MVIRTSKPRAYLCTSGEVNSGGRNMRGHSLSVRLRYPHFSSSGRNLNHRVLPDQCVVLRRSASWPYVPRGSVSNGHRAMHRLRLSIKASHPKVLPDRIVSMMLAAHKPLTSKAAKSKRRQCWRHVVRFVRNRVASPVVTFGQLLGLPT